MNELNTMRYKNGNKLKLNSSMKIIKKYMLSLVVITTILVGCGVSVKQDSGSMSSVEMSIVEKESTGEANIDNIPVSVDNNLSQGIIKDGVCLELISDIDMTPMHYLTFRKKDTTNGEIIKIEGEDHQLDISVQNLVAYNFEDGNLVMELNTLEENLPISIIFDGYEYLYSPTEVSPKTITLNYDISYDIYTAKIDKSEIYPNSIVLYLSNPNDKNAFHKAFILVDDDTGKETVANTMFTDEGMTLIFPGKDLGKKDIITVKIGGKDNYSFQDILLK